MFRIALGLIALRVIDGAFLQPAPGTSAGDHVVSGLAQLLLLGLVAFAHPRLKPGLQGALVLTTGVLGVATGLDAVYYARATGLSSDDLTGLPAIGAGLALVGLGAVTLWRSRRGGRWRYVRRLGLGAAGVLAVQAMLLPVGFGYVATHTARAVVPANDLRVPNETVHFRTRDGLELEGWYIPSRNGAAVIAFPGRKGPQRQARMLARHGYGVLLFDRRGEGRSEAGPNPFAWGGGGGIGAPNPHLKAP